MAEGQADTGHTPPKAMAKLHRMILQIIQSEKGKDAVSRDVTGRVTKAKGKSTKGKVKTATKGW
jgi:hypothetical protein